MIRKDTTETGTFGGQDSALLTDIFHALESWCLLAEATEAVCSQMSWSNLRLNFSKSHYKGVLIGAGSWLPSLCGVTLL